jgi:DNA adenine methylase
MSYKPNTIIAFNYFGGKYTHCDWILKHLPETKSYVEVFGGSGIILFNKKPVQIETYNDLNSTVVNFFEVLREEPEQLVRKIYLTPYSRQEYMKCYKNMFEGDRIEKARRFFVVVNQSFNGSYSRQTGWKMSTVESRCEISEAISRWLSKIPNLIIIMERLKSVQIGNYDFRLIFKKFNTCDTLLYCDPPYTHQERCNNNEYQHELTAKDQEDLLTLCLKSKSKIALSGYDNDLYNDILKGWFSATAKKKSNTLLHSPRREKLWMNYNPMDIILQTQIEF